MSTVLRLAVLVALAGVLSSCTSSGPTSNPTQVPSPTPTTPPTPQPPPTTEPPTPPPPPAPQTSFTYSGIVTDGTGRPVVGATVRGGPNSGSTDANGRYEFQ